MNEPLHDQDPLDDLLARARWGEPSGASLSRLATHYRVQRQKESWRRATRIVACVAVVFALATLTGVWWVSSGQTPQNAVAVHANPATSIPPAPTSAAAKPDPFASRPPTSIERAWLTMAEHKHNNPPKPEVDPVIERLKPAIVIMAGRPDSQPATVLCQTVGDLDTSIVEDGLLRLIPSLRGTRQSVATSLLHEVASPRSLRTYLRLFAVDDTAEAALPGVLRWAPTNTLAELIRTEQRSELQLGLLAGLMERGTPEAVAAYLALCDDPKTRAAAYLALERVQHPPYALLESYWSHGQMEMRFAAARVMGRLADGPMLQRLASQLHDPATQQPALIALMSSERWQAASLLDAASRRIPTLTSLRVTLEPETLTTRTPVALKNVHYTVAPDPT